MGYATEASRTLLDRAQLHFRGEVFAIIHLDNFPSQDVARKLGFQFVEQAPIGGETRVVLMTP